MRNISRFIAFTLLLILVFSLVSCEGYDEDVTERVHSYLAKEYPGKEFAIIDYKKHNETSGRYEVNLHCLDDGVEFKMYMYSSIAVTDSYSVERANTTMSKLVTEELGKDLSEKFKNTTWYNIFADRATNYRFREIALAENYSLDSLKTIYEIKIEDDLGAEEVAEAIYAYMYALCGGEEDTCRIERAEFVFNIDRVTYRFITDSESILSLGENGVVYYVIKSIEASSVSSSREVKIEYLCNEPTEDTESKE